MTNLTYAELAARAATSAQGLRDITARSSIRYEGEGVELDEVSEGEMDAEQQQRLITLLTERKHGVLPCCKALMACTSRGEPRLAVPG